MITEKISMAGRTAVVTGGAGGLGAAMSMALAEVGANLVIVDNDLVSLEATAKEIRTACGTKVIAVPCDVTVKEDVERAFSAAIAAFGDIHVLINNVGTTQRKLFIDMEEEEWDLELNRNLIHIFRFTQLAAKHMIAREIPGSIISLTTIEAYRGAIGYAPYGAAKAGIANFTQTMALELAPYGIRVNSIAPDATITKGLETIGPEIVGRLHDSWAHIPRNRRGRPDDFGGVAVFLASDLSEWITGQVIHVDGGTSAAAGWSRDEDGYWNNGGPPQAFSGRKLRESLGAHNPKSSGGA